VFMGNESAAAAPSFFSSFKTGSFALPCLFVSFW